jgi:MoaA/NifB/PqqE/SkfB family radical SAM enzyme
MPSLEQQINLLRGLMTGETAFSGPIFVDISLSSRCNLRCSGCPYHSPYRGDAMRALPANPYLPFELFANLCRDLRALQTQTLILQGEGEPLLHPQVADIVRLAKREQFDVMIITNGTLLNEQLTRTFIAARLDTLKVSLWASSPEQYQQNCPGAPAGQFEHMLENLRLVARLKSEQGSIYPRVTWTHPINRYNYETLDEVANLASAVGCDEVNFSPMTCMEGEMMQLVLSPDEVARVCASLQSLKRQMNMRGLKHNIDQALWRYRLGEAVWEKLPCYAGWFHSRIRTDGQVHPCGRCDTAFGNLQTQSFREIWNSPAIRAFRRQTLTRAGLAALGDRCNCHYCCYVTESARVHDIFRFFAPFVTRLGKSASRE